MHAPRLSIGLASLLVAVLIVGAVGIGSAIAVIPNNGTYYACLTKKTGAIKVINHPKVQCAKGQRLIQWNAKGPQGPQGAQGPQGVPGPADWNTIPNIPAGFADGVDDAGVTVVKIRTVTSTSPVTIAPDASGLDTADCPAGFLATGGGYIVSGYVAGFIVTQSSALDADTWQVAGSRAVVSGPAVTLTAQVTCMRAEPGGLVIAAKNSNFVPKKAKVRLPPK